MVSLGIGIAIVDLLHPEEGGRGTMREMGKDDWSDIGGKKKGGSGSKMGEDESLERDRGKDEK